jgi:type VI secretion system protein ImpH
MADSSGRQNSAVKSTGSGPGKKLSLLEELFKNPRGFSFLQAVRLLRQAHGRRGSDGVRSFFRDQLRIRPYLSLGFPPTDLVEVEELPAHDDPHQEAFRRFRMTATFLGLYGPSSPLPTFYTEELLDEQSEDKSVSRDFLDILNHGFFVLFALADAHYSLSQQVCEDGDEENLQRLFSLVGLGHQEMLDHSFNDPGALLRATGLLTQFPRSAAGLRGVLADRIGAPVKVLSCQPRNAVIPEDQRCCLDRDGNALGRESWLGSRVADAMGKISIRVGPVDADTFERYLPGRPGHDELLRVIRFYCTQPLEFDLEFDLDRQQAQPGRLGTGRWSGLGCDVWLSAGPLDQARAVFPERRRIWDDHQQRSIVL